MRQWAYMELGDERAITFVAMATPEYMKANAEVIFDSRILSSEVPGGSNANKYETGVALGIKFIGPTAPVMSVLGDKIAPNILAQTANVPLIPWNGSFGGDDDGPLQANLNEEAVVAAERIGYKGGLTIQACEGGGGKGIRFVDNEKDLRNAYVQVQNEVIGSPIFIMQLCKNGLVTWKFRFL